MNINRTSIPDQVMNELLQVISSGEIKPGEKLPSEHELCELFGVSRPSVKTAIDRLNLLGIVEQKVGDGTYVKDTATSDLLSVYARYFINYQELPQLLDLARTLENESLRLLAAKPDSGRLEFLNNLSAAINQAARAGDNAALYENILAFHTALCSFNANPYVIQIHSMLRPALQAAIGASAASTAPTGSPDSCYTRICLALQHQNAETAVNEMNTIFQTLTNQLTMQEVTHDNESAISG